MTLHNLPVTCQRPWHTLCRCCACAVQMPDVEVWYQRASDVVRKLRLGDIDLGIVGYDMYSEIGEADK